MAVWYTHDVGSVERFTVPLPERARLASRCHHCKEDPYVLIDKLSFILSLGNEYKEQGCSHNEIFYALYCDVTYEIHGTLGRGVRKALPKCVELFIKNRWPKPTEQVSHVGFVGQPNPW